MKKLSSRMLVCILTVAVLCSILAVSVFASGYWFEYNMKKWESCRFGPKGTGYDATSWMSRNPGDYASVHLDYIGSGAVFYIANINREIATQTRRVGAEMTNDGFWLQYTRKVSYEKLMLYVQNLMGSENNPISGWWNP